MKRFILGMSLAVTVMFMGFASSASALTLWITDGSNFVSITDGGVGDIDGDAGELAYNGTVGNFNIIFGGGSSKTVANPDPTMDFGGFVTSNTSGGFLRMWLTDTDMNNVVPSITGAASATITGASDVIAFNAYWHKSNEFGGTSSNDFIAGSTPGGGYLGGFGPFRAPGGFASNSARFNVPGNPFGMTLTAVISHTGASSTSFNFATSVPEPGTIILLGLGFLGMGFYARKRQA